MSRPLTFLYHQKLASSGLDDPRIIRSLHLSVEPAEHIASLDPSFEKRGGFLIPYFDLGGKPDLSFYRVRYLERPTGFGVAAEKERRYAQLPETPPRAYFPPLLDRSWRAIAKDPSVGVIITEGELKAACSCLAGAPTIGLGGVYSFRSAKAGFSFLPELEAFEWTKRKATIVYDSDLATNAGVAAAMRALANALTDRGAVVTRGFVPPGPAGEKQGLDDLLAPLTKRGRQAALTKMLEEAEPFSRSAELWALNDEVALIETMASIINLHSLDVMKPEAFLNTLYADRFYFDSVTDAKGNVKLVEKSLPKEWMKWPHRRKVRDLVYSPGLPRLVDDHVNIWPGWGVEPEPGDVRIWREVLDHVFGDDGNARSWFERWAAIQVQQPGVKLYTAVVLCSIEQGTGKTFLAYALGQVFGKNFMQIGATDLRSAFNQWAYAKQLILGEEIAGGEDKRLDADLLKSLITQTKITVNKKYQPPFTVEDHANYIFTTNHPDAFYLEETDRRFFVHRLRNGPLPLPLAKRFEDWVYTRAGAAALHHHLKTLDLAGFSATAFAPATTAKREMKHLSRSDLEVFAADLAERPDDVLAAFGPSFVRDLWTAEELLVLRFPSGRITTNALARALTRAGVPRLAEGGVIQTPLGARRLYAVRNRARWLKAQPKEIGEAYSNALSGNEKFAAEKPKHLRVVKDDE